MTKRSIYLLFYFFIFSACSDTTTRYVFLDTQDDNNSDEFGHNDENDFESYLDQDKEREDHVDLDNNDSAQINMDQIDLDNINPDQIELDKVGSEQSELDQIFADEIKPSITVIVNSMPEQGANFFIDGVLICSTQCTADVEIGWHIFRFEKMGYETIDYDFEVTTDTTVITAFLIENPDLISFELSSSPIDAQVFIDSEAIGITPVQAFLMPGEYFIELFKDGYYPYVDNLSVDVGMPDVSFDLQPIPQINVDFTSSPDGVTVCIDEQICSESQITPFSEAFYAGSYTIYASKGGYIADFFETEISVADNEVHIVLNPINLQDYLGWLDGTFELEGSLPAYQVMVTTEPHDATRWRVHGFDPPTPSDDYLFGAVNSDMEIMIYHGSDWWIIGYGDQDDQSVTFDYVDWDTAESVYYKYQKIN